MTALRETKKKEEKKRKLRVDVMQYVQLVKNICAGV